ncbi:MAG: protein kinase [Gemmataceae bacterium]|nr:protein kinase [Planctomycetia bacterium]MBX3397286.1 protein kinase [Gemmataceae bacterium]
MPDSNPSTDAPSSTPYAGASTADTPLVVGRYRIVDKLGEGGMGAVYLAEDQQLGRRKVALKIPSGPFTKEATLRKRFLREALASARLDHPHICPIYDSGEDAGQLFIVMKYVKGQSLGKLVGADKLWEPDKAAAFVRAVAHAIQHAHDEQVIHRDLKPGNIMVTERSDPMVMDFGLAKILSDESMSQLTHGALGTPEYMSLEQWDNDDPRPSADVYALGVILFKMLTGRTPFTGSPRKIMTQLAKDPMPALRQFRPDCDAELEAIVAQGMAKEEKDRYPTMAAFAAALEDYPRRRAAAAKPKPAPPPKPSNAPDNEIEFELDLDVTPPPAKKPVATPPKEVRWSTDDDEFDLRLDTGPPPPPPPAPAMEDSDFKLTLDDSGISLDLTGDQNDIFETDFELPPMDEFELEPEKDVFETDFEIPALEETPGASGGDFELKLDDVPDLGPDDPDDDFDAYDASHRAHEERMNAWLQTPATLEFVRDHLHGWTAAQWDRFVDAQKKSRYWPLKTYEMEKYVRELHRMEIASRNLRALRERTSEKVRFLCPNCYKSVVVMASYAGKRVKCPKCEGRFDVPRT